MDIRHSVDLPDTEALEVYYLMKDRGISLDDALTEMYSTYKGALFPRMLAEELGHSPNELESALKTIWTEIDAPSPYWIFRGLNAVSPPREVIVSEQKKQLILSAVYGLLSHSENFTTVSRPPKRWLDVAFGGSITQDEWYSAYMSALDEDLLKVVKECKDDSINYTLVRDTSKQDVAKSVVHATARLATVGGNYFIGTPLAIGVAVVGGLDIMCLPISYMYATKFIALTFIIWLICCLIFAYEFFIAYARHVRLMLISFVLGLCGTIMSILAMIIVLAKK